MRVVVMEDYQRVVERLECFGLMAGHDVVVHSERPSGLVERASQIGDAQALVLIRERTPIDEPLLALVPDLRLICQTGRGMPHIDVDACTRRGIAVCNGSGSPFAPAELTLALILASTRCLVTDAVALRSGVWQTTVGRELHGRLLGIVGYGSIGSVVAGYGNALGMRVVVWGRAGSLERAAADGYGVEPDLDALCACSDVLSLHLKLTPETRGILSSRRLGLMRTDALLVNTSRAGLIEPGALVAALEAGRPGSAAVDVFDEEPATADPLVRSDAVLATPHLGYVTWETYESFFGEAFSQVNAFDGGVPVGVVNPEALRAGARGAEHPEGGGPTIR